MTYHTPTPTLKKKLCSFVEYRVEGLGSVNYWLFALLEDAFACGALDNLNGACAADPTMSPPASIVVATSVPSRSSSSSSPSSISGIGGPDGVPYSLVRMCLAQVTLLPTALTKLTGTNCLEVSADSARQMSSQLSGGTLIF